MCHFASGLIDVDCERFYCADLESHSGTYEFLKLKPDSYREFEWLKDDDGASLSVRIKDEPICDGEPRNENFYKACIPAKFSTRKDFIHWAVPNLNKVNLFVLSSYIEYNDKGQWNLIETALDAKSAEYVDARGCTALTKKKGWII